MTLHDIDPLHGVLDKITPALAEVLSYLRDGLRTPQIAEKRGVSVNTVQKQVEHLLGITGLHSADALAAWWARWQHAWLARLAERARIPLPPARLPRAGALEKWCNSA